MSEAETLKSGMNMEKLLMERVMLRKELKLRSMQERLLDQTRKLEEAEQRLEEFERLPGITQFMAMVRLGQQVSQTGGSVAQRTVSYLVFLYQVILSLPLIPFSPPSLVCSAWMSHTGGWCC